MPSLLPRLRANKQKFNDNDYDDIDLDLSTGSEAGSEIETQAEAEKTDNQKLLRLLEVGEKVTHMYRTARIQGLDTMEGLLLFGKEHFYVVDGFTLLKSKEIADIDTIPSE